ncbi:OPT oligopeptide transporter protein-domain-containing protein [Lophiotrema nucula]|uniref:OPT oligopeptide transporter protein-domain-containing protein n=1 Tax=Lophiotrema nucula TaxID=690887 RepID=A0A6A5YQ33_9PLEO|nr:OPT oligopeptide transporter protein-domain-containing protein [Lophiotrema nucula]
MAGLFQRLRPKIRPASADTGHGDPLERVETTEELANNKTDPGTTNVKTSDPEKPDTDIPGLSGPASADDVEDLPEDVRALPQVVRNIVSLEDDPTAPTITFRYFLLCLIYVPPGAVLYQMSVFRTAAPAYPVLFVQVASHYTGLWLSKILPHKVIRVPFTSFSFSLNPGPWHVKENVLVTVTAASGATSNAAWTPISIGQLFYDTHIPAAAAIFFMWAIVYIGYAMAALARQFLLYDPIYTWPYALMQTALFETLRKNAHDSRIARKQKYVFFGVLTFAIVWHFLPEYAFQMLASLSFLCWVAPHNRVANFIGAGYGGMGVLNLTLDWANVSTGNFVSPMILPFWVTAILTVAFILSNWILLPAAKWGNLGETKIGLVSNHLFQQNGSTYPAARLVTKDFKFNQTAYDELGPVIMSSPVIWQLFFDYASYISALTWLGLFGYPMLRDTVIKLRTRAKDKGRDKVSDFYNDRLNVLMREYKEVPLWWYIALFVASFVTIITILACGYFFIPIWTFFVALGTSGAMIFPFGWLYALSSFQVQIGSFNELLYGYMVNAGSGHRHPSGASTYGAIGGDIWYRAQYMLQDQKIGHYMHVSPRAIFFSQIFGELMGVPINYGIIQWVLKSKREYLLGDKVDALHQWTGQRLVSSNNLGVQYVLIGPKRLFQQHMYNPLQYGFLFGALAPVIVYALHRAFPRSPLRFRLWNVTIFASGMSIFYGNVSTGYISQFIVAYICMHYYLKHRFETWKRYNFLVAAALDAGFSISLLLMFIIFNSGKQIQPPVWWGNDERSSERCFAEDY